MGEVDYQFQLGSLQMSSGRHYWEIKVMIIDQIYFLILLKG